MRIGEKITWTPSDFEHELSGERADRMRKLRSVTGRIVYIHPARRYYMAEANVGNEISYLHDAGEAGAVLIEFPVVPLGHGIHGNSLPGQVQHPAPPDAVVGLKIQKRQLIVGKGLVKSIHAVVVPISPGVRVFSDGAAVRGQGKSLDHMAGAVFPVPHRTKAPPEGVGHGNFPQHERGHIIIGPHLEHHIKRRVIHRYPGVPVLSIKAEWNQAEGVGQDNLHGMARQATYYNEASAVDIDAITDGLALVPTAASKGCPISGSFVFIMQMFYGNLDTTRSRTQIAFPYAGGSGIAVRSYDSNKSVWSEWNLVYTANTPPPVMNGATSSKAGTAGLAPAPAAGAQGKFLRGDGTWQTPYTHPSYTAKVSGLYKITVDKTGHVSGAETIHTGRAARFIIGTSTAGWTEADCDYLCDGTADEVEIKAAISALPSGGGEVLLLDGTYNISSSIAISKAKVVLRGAGPSTVLKRIFNVLTPNGVLACAASNCILRDMRIDGNKTSYTSSENRAIYASQSAENILIREIVCDASYNGIALSGMSGARIIGCTVRTTSARGILISGASGILLDENLISGNGGHGIVVEGTEDIRILNNAISNTVDYGIYIDEESKCGIISGNTGDQPRDRESIYAVGSAFVITGNVVGSINLAYGSNSNIVAHNILTSEDVLNSGTNNLVESNKVFTEEVTA